MPPSPNVTNTEQVGTAPGHEVVFPVHQGTQQGIKDIIAHLEPRIEITLKPYDDSAKEWEAFAAKNHNSKNVLEKIKQYEIRIQTLVHEDKCSLISRSRPKVKDSSTVEGPPIEGFIRERNDLGNGSIVFPMTPAVVNSSNSSTLHYQGIGFKSSLVLFLCLHLSALSCLYLASGLEINVNTIYLGLFNILISIGAHFGLRKRIRTKSRPLRFLISLLQPTIFKDYYFEWARRTPHQSTRTERNGVLKDETKAPQNSASSKRSLGMMGIWLGIMWPIVGGMIPWVLWNEDLWTCWLILWPLESCLSLYLSLVIG